MAFEHLTKKELLEKMESLRLEVAEYEKAESEKLYEEKLYRSLAVTAEAGVYIVKDGLFRFVNQFTALRLGCKPAELIGMRAFDFIHPDDREMVRKKASDMLRGKRSAPYEFRTIGKDGKIHWILESVTSIEFGAARAILGQSMDITRQVEARDRLAELEALEASILESIPHAVIGLKNRQIIFANDGVEKVFGWKREEVISRSTRIFYRSKKEWADGADNLYRSLETQRTFSAEVVRKKKNGTPIICRLTASRIGEALVDRQVVITYEDITDQKTAEEVYMTMAESSQVGVYVVQDGTFKYMNKVGAAYAGYQVDELIGRTRSCSFTPMTGRWSRGAPKTCCRARARPPTRSGSARKTDSPGGSWKRLRRSGSWGKRPSSATPWTSRRRRRRRASLRSSRPSRPPSWSRFPVP